jgi:hypothetical protein
MLLLSLFQQPDELLKIPGQHNPRGLKAARDDKNNELAGTTEVAP